MKIGFPIIVLSVAVLAACGVDKTPQMNGISRNTGQQAATAAPPDQATQAAHPISSSEKLAPLHEKSSEEGAKKGDGEKTGE